MEIDAKIIKDLRETTGAGILECKKALEETKGDKDKALTFLRERGLKIAQKTQNRTAKEGLIGSYIHGNGKIGVLVEVNCETDFVAKTEEFKELVKDISLQIAASKPLYLNIKDVPEDFRVKELEIFKNQARNEKKPEKMLENIAQGKLNKRLQEICLLEQPFVKDLTKKITDRITECIAKLGENIVINRFVRFERGEKT